MEDKRTEVLVVDNEEDFRQLMTFWLKSKGFLVRTAPDGESAIKVIREGTVDVVFLDLRMPVIDGAETLKRIRKFNKSLPVIIISAYVDDPIAKEAISCGISGVFYKDKNFEEGLSLLQSILRRKKNKG